MDPNYIANTIVAYPRVIEFSVEGGPWQRMAWAELARQYPDANDSAALRMSISGRVTIGGNAAPSIEIRRG